MKRESTKAEFKNTLFAHGLVNQNPRLFFKLYPEDYGMDEEEEQELDFAIPTSESDLSRMIAEFGGEEGEFVPAESLRGLPLAI